MYSESNWAWFEGPESAKGRVGLAGVGGPKSSLPGRPPPLALFSHFRGFSLAESLTVPHSFQNSGHQPHILPTFPPPNIPPWVRLLPR